MKCTQANFLDWAEDGMAVTCGIDRTGIEDARLSREGKYWYICQDKEDGEDAVDKKGYKFSWWIGKGSCNVLAEEWVENLRPCKVATPSHHRNPSPESELVGSCTLLKKWKWRTGDTDDEFLWTHKPEWDKVWKGWDYGKATGKAWACGNKLPRIPVNGLKPSERLYRRQGDKWVHVG